MREYSCCCLTRSSWLRSSAIQLWAHPWFDRFIVGCILLNCAILALNDPLDVESDGWRNKVIEAAELPFTIIFTIEMIVKIIAMDFIGPKSYLSDAWNWLDFVVVLTG